MLCPQPWQPPEIRATEFWVSTKQRRMVQCRKYAFQRPEKTPIAHRFWLEKETNPDGSIRTDLKNPDPAKRSTPSSQVVLIESVSYDAEEQKWQDGQIYDPTSGKTYKVVIVFDDPTTLRVRGYWGPFSKSMYWTKIE